tara:strand:+ start:10300 stop:10497 length:198 start_codon:yes stop_codon:yes gene_type:complete
MIELYGSHEQMTAAIEAAGGQIGAGHITVQGSATRHGIEFTAVGANLYSTDDEFVALVRDQVPAE